MTSESTVMGCMPCGTRWIADQCCWMCGRPGVESPFHVTSGEQSRALGMTADINEARTLGCVASADPCGGGPIQRAAQ